MSRLAFVLPNLGGGGAERVALTLIQGFLDRGHEVDLVVMDARGELHDLVPKSVEVFDLKAKQVRGALLPIIRYLRKRRPKALHASLWPLTIIAILAGVLSRSKTRIVVSDHTILSAHYGASQRTIIALKATARLFYPLAGARVCVSEAVAEDLSRVSGLSRELFTIIYNPVVQMPLLPASSDVADQIWPTTKHRVLAVGSLKDEKNHALLLRSFALLDPDLGASLVILGEGPLREALERLAKELGIADRVVLPGFRTDPRPFYGSADLFVLSSHAEGFGNVLVESLAAGLPVISTDCGGPREILAGGRHGRLVPVGDSGALASAMKQALGDTHDPEAARARARSFEPSGVTEQYLAVMQVQNISFSASL